MRKHCFILVLMCLLTSVEMHAQFSKSLHDVFELEEAKELRFDVAGNVKVENWKGGVILVETKVDLFNASRDLLNFLLESQRYTIVADVVDYELTIASISKDRNSIQTKEGIVDEQVNVTIRVPEDFIISEDRTSATYIGSGPVISKIDQLHPKRDSTVVAKKTNEER